MLVCHSDRSLLSFYDPVIVVEDGNGKDLLSRFLTDDVSTQEPCYVFRALQPVPIGFI